MINQSVSAVALKIVSLYTLLLFPETCLKTPGQVRYNYHGNYDASFTMRIVMVLEYDGSNFCGWQSQPAGNTVQDLVEAALSEIAGDPIRVVTAGRTDAGVHAAYQVLHFDTQAERPMNAWVRGANALLPDSIAMLWASRIADDFHARYCAIERCYLYLLLNHSVRPGLHRHKIGWFHQPLDLELMQKAAQTLVGEHDFSAFRAAECQAKSPVRTVTKLKVTRVGSIVAFELRANAFLHHMVRNIVGCLIYVGKGKYQPDWIGGLLESGKRSDAAPTFSASGLYLAGVAYDARWKLPSFPEPPFAAIVSGTNRPGIVGTIADGQEWGSAVKPQVRDICRFE